ncbi:Bug family tripartite tricarboxylate transporter substrate binding protein [Cupriavidus gilardii]|uniref:Tripartite tricarboxylate transporter substrate binding protein n=1 Tax=Cupriavidus gilardii TaxID=82541 RepID=A0ABY4VKN3_9BURK|nr:tripartite tricarboxylate transporter substrate binding protein [Cupriavidus gilardii]MCT9070262.1 tripartite tricarboxylate transporter substrate binding protein [Cupriavidus gilardii]QKS61332.1 tripartite tricarboxylate transporter substrate binding protein [Cupriavidus gilardii]USE77791.1 tripartite tricarboxylate transporter substrate binding protein [Cupriavidus gilardii]UXC38737.1 tripartite tricarboxylate transporter substrate binding protein [Cupriavidus gilardii]
MKKALLALLAVCGMAAVAPAQADPAWPSKPIRLVIPFPPGGGTDILSRLVANQLTQSAKWTVVPDNRPGAGGTIGIAEAVRATPNGYELVMGQKDNLIVAPWLYKTVKYDPTKDLVAVTHVAYTPIMIVAPANSPFKNIADVVAAAKRAPGSIKYGSPGNGTTIHLAAEIFSQAAGIKLLHVPYKGSNAAMMDAIAGNVDLMVASVPSAMAQIKAGKLRALAVTSATRSTSLPDVPTLAESGYKQVDVSTWYGIFAPAKTPREVVDKLAAEVNKQLATPAMIQAIHEQGAEPKVMTQKQFADLVQSDYRKWKTIVQESGATVE